MPGLTRWAQSNHMGPLSRRVHRREATPEEETGEMGSGRPTLPLPLALKMEEEGHEPRHVALEVGNSTWLTARNPKELKSASNLDKPGDRVSSSPSKKGCSSATP